MALKWAGILVSVIAITLAVTANLFATDDALPDLVNMVSIAAAAVAIVVAIMADLYVRIDTKLDRLNGLVLARFDQLDEETGDRNAGFVEGYLLSRAPESSVVPLAPRGRRAMGDD